MNILCFGDSNTWGYKPDKSGRYDENIRWTGLLQKKARIWISHYRRGTLRQNNCLSG